MSCESDGCVMGEEEEEDGEMSRESLDMMQEVHILLGVLSG